ncbi:MmcQ/YjbR family DNA-binding protein [Kitasatospora sp. RG8]|uniref:MmcQ/YjbR family DNA-binding protein n=1 Tax=Kitasatospora sp. RG8 TaxID=2820815 RepID=UPI001AE0CB56|nr:MmcQ/YjbR family DNA-binding protein [Kitasatospora sp. RG8]MBP0451641.1 MmcQ/YjbR family DNA-binding protein [Kitasatospora sp. RG8]
MPRHPRTAPSATAPSATAGSAAGGPSAAPPPAQPSPRKAHTTHATHADHGTANAPGASEAAVERLRALCLALPEVSERVSHGEPTWFAGAGRRARVFVMLADHHHDDRLAFWCPAPAGAQEFLIAEDRDRFFRPPYVGHRGWVGVYLDVPPVDWARVQDLVADAHALVAG